jgi:hypothetical protein
MRNILCFEGEWKFNNHRRKNRFNHNSEPILKLLKEFYNSNYAYRHIITQEDLEHYFKFFNRNISELKKFEVIYFSCHGWHHSISLGSENGNLDLDALAKISGNFFRDKIVHFSCCKTMANPNAVLNFKEKTGAKLVTGYTKSVDVMDSSIADTAILKELITSNKLGNIKNEDISLFRKKYKSLLDTLGFEAM